MRDLSHEDDLKKKSDGKARGARPAGNKICSIKSIADGSAEMRKNGSRREKESKIEGGNDMTREKTLKRA